jgi:hypothetical protein
LTVVVHVPVVDIGADVAPGFWMVNVTGPLPVHANKAVAL